MISFSVELIKEIEPLLKSLYGISWVDFSNDVLCLRESPNYDLYKDELQDKDSVRLPVPYDDSDFQTLCAKYKLNENSLTSKVLSFIFMFYKIGRPSQLNKYDINAQDYDPDYWAYVKQVRPEMLKIYLSLCCRRPSEYNGEPKYHDKCKIQFGNREPITVDIHIPWLQMELRR
jgi:hypothetical protein